MIEFSPECETNPFEVMVAMPMVIVRNILLAAACIFLAFSEAAQGTAYLAIIFLFVATAPLEANTLRNGVIFWLVLRNLITVALATLGTVFGGFQLEIVSLVLFGAVFWAMESRYLAWLAVWSCVSIGLLLVMHEFEGSRVVANVLTGYWLSFPIFLGMLFGMGRELMARLKGVGSGP